MSDPGPQNDLEWLVIFLVYNNSTYDIEKGANNHYIKMEIQKNSLFHAIQDSPFADKIKIVIVEARIAFKNSHITQVIHILEKKTNHFQGIQTPGNLPVSAMSEAEGMSAILAHLTTMFPAKRNMWITFGHGAVFGINYLTALQETINADKDDKKSGGNSNHKNYASNLLTNKELSSVIRSVLGAGKKLDLLVMYNCLMQNVFTQYELSGTVDYLVAPVSGIGHPGYNYREVFKYLSAQPWAHNAEVAKLFLNSCASNRIPDHQSFLPEILRTWKIHAIKLDEELYAVFREKFCTLFNAAFCLLNNNHKILYTVKLADRQLFNNATYTLDKIKITELNFFLTYWLEVLERFPSLSEIIPYISNLVDILNRISSYSFVGKNYFECGFLFKDTVYRNHCLNDGFGIWMPNKSALTNNDLFEKIIFPKHSDENTPTLLRESKYQEFFAKYLELYS